MRQTTGTRKSPGGKIVKDIKRATRKPKQKVMVHSDQGSQFTRRER